MQRGFYFDAVFEPVDTVFACTSRLIADSYWNYAFLSDNARVTPTTLSQVGDTFRALNRQPALLLDAEGFSRLNDLRISATVFSSDLWMELDKAAYRSLEGLGPAKMKLSELDSRGIDEAAFVFNDAYTTADELSGGYSGLPEEYTVAFTRGVQNAAQFGSLHFIGRYEGKAVAVGSVYFAGDFAGIYNVAVVRDARRRGFGKQISAACIDVALQKGVPHIFLQTVQDSPVESLYATLGFHRLFQMNLYQLDGAR